MLKVVLNCKKLVGFKVQTFSQYRENFYAKRSDTGQNSYPEHAQG